MSLQAANVRLQNRCANFSHVETSMGICADLYAEACVVNFSDKRLAVLLIRTCKELGIYSGNNEFPIMHPEGGCAESIYFEYAEADAMYDKRSLYGQRRMMVLCHLKNKIAKLVK